MKRHAAHIVIIICLAFSGGCAVVPALITTGASMAVPQTASMVITAASTVHKTVLFAADERNADDMLADKILSLQAQTILLTDPRADMEASSYNGDIYLTGEFATPADRDRIVARLQQIKGVRSVKGVIRQQPSDMLAAIKPAVTDSHAETVIETGLFKELHVRSANVDVAVVQGEAVVMGVVRDRQEEQRVLDIVRSLVPESFRPIAVTSLLARQDAYEAHETQDNDQYALLTRRQMLAETAQLADPEQAMADFETGGAEPGPKFKALYARYFPKKTWSKARHRMKNRILRLAKAERDSKARTELITLSSRVLKDRRISIQDRLVKTLGATRNASVRNHVDAILDDIAPRRAERIRILAMN
ncbi:MAG: BON domain-containing protein [Desulfovibrionaceae bacterium]|nr:BON domain-containing protein [Desulfovibrionaceae bacterium]